ncbi:phosphatase PAP2 family protein [Variovorax sp. RT4R15]|uniref:phosphatase PAP2 family protein n=1 Tax=Variovorax sp. RT4R15 TaxID=3443737 RepID=UPI003F461F28
MSQWQIHIFELLNAGPGLDGMRLALALALASYSILVLPVVVILAGWLGNREERSDVMWATLACIIAFAASELVEWVWPQPRPFDLHLGTQYLVHALDRGLPSDHVTLFWTAAIAAFATRRFAAFGFPLFTLGLAVGWDRIYLGVQFPLDVGAAFPVAAFGVAVAWTVRAGLAQRPVSPAKD